MILLELPLAKLEEEIRRIEDQFPLKGDIEAFALGCITSLRWLIERSPTSPSEAVRLSRY